MNALNKASSKPTDGGNDPSVGCLGKVDAREADLAVTGRSSRGSFTLNFQDSPTVYLIEVELHNVSTHATHLSLLVVSRFFSERLLVVSTSFSERLLVITGQVAHRSGVGGHPGANGDDQKGVDHDAGTT